MNDPMIRRTIVTALVAVPVGYALGAAWVLYTREPIRETVEVVKTPSEEALLALCEEIVPEGTHERLQRAVAKIGQLEGQLVEKERELSALETARADNDQARAALAKQRSMLQAEVRALRKALEVVAVERDELLVELKETVEALDAQVVETERQRTEKEKWRRVSTDEAWSRFLAEAKVALCDRGTRKRQDRCEQHVDDILIAKVKAPFQECLLTNQAVPTLGQLSRPEDTLPPRAIRIPDDRSVPGKGHYVVLCDPALPESALAGKASLAGDDDPFALPSDPEAAKDGLDWTAPDAVRDAPVAAEAEAPPSDDGEDLSLDEALDRALQELEDAE